jgi:hypothetical protein
MEADRMPTRQVREIEFGRTYEGQRPRTPFAANFRIADNTLRESRRVVCGLHRALRPTKVDRAVTWWRLRDRVPELEVAFGSLAGQTGRGASFSLQ